MNMWKVQRSVVTIMCNDGVSDGKLDSTILEGLKAAGLSFAENDVDHERGMVSGVCDRIKLHDVETVKGASYVRHVHDYWAEVPAEEPVAAA